MNFASPPEGDEETETKITKPTARNLAAVEASYFFTGLTNEGPAPN